MKTLAPITVGEYTVNIAIEDHGQAALKLTATCGLIKERGTLHLQGPHDHTAEQLQKDVDAFALKLATIAAGKEQSRKLKSALLGG